MNTTELRALAETLEHECALRLIAGGKNHEEAQACEQAADYLRQCAEQRPDGWQLVPVEPTPAMKSAGGHVNSEWLNDDAPLYESRYAMSMDGVWSAMLAAAPAAPQAEPIADSDADYWLRHRQAILDAIERAGFVLMSDANRFWLHHKGECDFVEAAAWVYAGWTAAPKAEHAHGITGDSDACR